MSDVEAATGIDHSDRMENGFLVWEGAKVTVKDRQSKQKKAILSNVHGMVKAGEVLAIMGPSGSGKSTLLNMLAHRTPSVGSTVSGNVFIDHTSVNPQKFRKISAYVEQDDALVGSLTVRETLDFAARLALPKSVNASERQQRVDMLLRDFGLSDQANNLIGTPIRKGISGGQKRRVSVAAQLVTRPKIIFLDEPTSGLDSAAAFEVVRYLKEIAQRYKLIVITSMHQPSTSVFAMCDRLLLLSQGRTAYSGRVGNVQAYFECCGYPIPMYMNPAEFALDFVNTDFSKDRSEVQRQLNEVQESWQKSFYAELEQQERAEARARVEIDAELTDEVKEEPRRGTLSIAMTLVQRSSIKAHRDILPYHIRTVMYFGLALMMGTIWLRLEPKQDNIQSFINAIFFGGAFMSFMAVAYIPAFLEDHAIFVREQADGLYGPTSFVIANFVIGIPYLFATSLTFSLVVYWLSNFRSGPQAFFTWTAWLFIDLIAAESLVVLISSLLPIFVVALAGTAFANGLWMCTGGFLVPSHILNAFWRYLFHYIDYQSYVFQGMMVNEFGNRNYTCSTLESGDCACMYESKLADQCLIEGNAVLESYGFDNSQSGRSIVIMFAIIAGYRLLSGLVLYLKVR